MVDFTKEDGMEYIKTILAAIEKDD